MQPHKYHYSQTTSGKQQQSGNTTTTTTTSSNSNSSSNTSDNSSGGNTRWVFQSVQFNGESNATQPTSSTPIVMHSKNIGNAFASHWRLNRENVTPPTPSTPTPVKNIDTSNSSTLFINTEQQQQIFELMYQNLFLMEEYIQLKEVQRKSKMSRTSRGIPTIQDLLL
jgi:hypothetical protein